MTFVEVVQFCEGQFNLWKAGPPRRSESDNSDSDISIDLNKKDSDEDYNNETEKLQNRSWSPKKTQVVYQQFGICFVRKKRLWKTLTLVQELTKEARKRPRKLRRKNWMSNLLPMYLRQHGRHGEGGPQHLAGALWRSRHPMTSPYPKNNEERSSFNCIL